MRKKYFEQTLSKEANRKGHRPPSLWDIQVFNCQVQKPVKNVSLEVSNER